MNKSKIYIFLFYILLAGIILALTSCASDDIAMSGEQKGGRMSLGLNVMQVTEGSKSRAAAPAIKSYQMKNADGKPVYAQFSSEAYIDKHAAVDTVSKESRGVSITSDTFYDRFGLFYYEYGKNESWANISAANTAPTVSNMAVEKSAGWLTDKYWPGADHKLTFMAYAPYDNDYKNASGTKYIQLASNIAGYPTLTYTVPDKVEDQQDLLVSAEPNTQDVEGDYNKVIGMKFYHTLSAINFKIGSTMAPGRIAKIEIKGIYNKGVYDFGTRNWTSQSGSANYSITPNYVVADQRGVVFTGVDDSKNDLFLVMPQTVPAGAKIVVTIEDGANYSSSHEMELPLDGHEWLPGYTITYSLSTSQENSDYIFSVSKIANIDKAATAVSYKVSSYVQSYYGSQTPVGWKAKYAIDDQIETEDDYSEDFGDVVKGGFVFDMPSPTATTSAITANIAELEPPVSDSSINTHTATLRAAAPLGSQENPYDLSTLGGARSQSTANCYIVHAPGWYKLPIVYGNCIKNGANNTAVYGTSTAMANFVNHLDKQITDPWLKNNANVAPTEGILVWQDAYKMIDTESIGITEDQKYLYFKVNEDYICQGNALLSVRDASKKILWSWLIWVTDEDMSSATDVPITNLSNSVYNLMATPVGLCRADKRKYTPRTLLFQFEQEESQVVAEVSFDQTTTSIQEFGNNAPYFQYGRSVPQNCSNGVSTNASYLGKKTLYYGSNYVINSNTGKVSTGTGIQTPFTQYGIQNGNWNKSDILNQWDVTNKGRTCYDKQTKKSIKSIYDPSPAGYKVPEPAAFTAFTSSNLYSTNNKVYTFYTKPSKQGTTISVLPLGYANHLTNSNNVMIFSTQNAFYLSSTHDASLGWVFSIINTTGAIATGGGGNRCIARTIWPVADD